MVRVVITLEPGVSHPHAHHDHRRKMTQEEKAKEVKCGVERESARTACSYLLDLEYQLAQSYYWSGSFLKDLFFFVCNWHPFIGMFLSHPRHPWDKKERLMTFFVSCSITMLPSALIVETMADSGFSIWESHILIFVVITLPVMLIEIALYWLNIGDIFCRGSRWLDCLADGVVCVRNGCVCISVFVSFVCLAISYLVVQARDEDLRGLTYPFVMSRLQSYVMWFPIWFLLPFLGFWHCWWMERQSIEQAQAQASSRRRWWWWRRRA